MRKLSPLFRITFLFVALLLTGLRSYSQTITGTLTLQYIDDSHVKLNLVNAGGTAWSTYCGPCQEDVFFCVVWDSAYQHLSADSFVYLAAGLSHGIDPDFTVFVGPQSNTYHVKVGTIHGSPNCGGACYLYNASTIISTSGNFPISGTIAAPDQLNAIVDALPPGFQGGKLSWHKKSALPDSLLKYIIYRDLTVLDTIASTDTIMSYTDNTLLTSGFYGYRVMSYTPGGTTREGFTWPAQYSPVASSPIGYINMPDMHLLTASDGVAQGRTDLSWPNISGYCPNGIAILRNGQQLTVLNRFQTSYSDYTGVPGVPYQYAIAAIADDGTTPYRFTDTGYAKPNGTISGSVKSPLGSGVQGVLITATSLVDGIAHTDTTSTDALGRYTLHLLYYDTAATFVLRPSRDTDFFTPAFITQRLDVQNYSVNVSDFIDTTVFTIRGHVYFADIGSFRNLPLQGATLYVNGIATSVLTNSSGAYQYTASSLGDYNVSFGYKNHPFDHASQLVHVPGPAMGSVDFRDLKRDTLTIDLRSTCHSRIVDNATFNVTSYPNPVIDSFASFDGTHPTLLILPGTTYRVSIPRSVVGGNPNPLISTQGPLGRLNVAGTDLSERVTTTVITADTTLTITGDTFRILATNDTIFYPADTTIAVTQDTVSKGPHADIAFVYHDSMQIALQQVPQLCNAADEYLVKQGETIFARVQITENFNYGGIHTSCPRDSGVLQIYDAVSGAGFTTVPFTNGTYLYTMIPGQPNVPDLGATHRYEKLLNLYVNDNILTANYNAWMMIEGVRTLAPTFNTTPQIPLMVLHDPPGGASYSSLERDSSVSLNLGIDITSSNTTTVGASEKVGHTVSIPFISGDPIPGPYGQIAISTARTSTTDNSQSTTMTFTASNTISTSSDPAYVGFNGDVFIGGSMNMKYAQGFRLRVDSTCTAKVDSVLAYGIDSVSTQFVYSVKDLKGTILPNLYHLMALAPDSGSFHNKDYFQDQINVWNDALGNDSIAQATSSYTHNVSFTSGTSYDYTQVSDRSFSSSTAFSVNRNSTGSATIGIGDGSLIDINAGISLNLNSNATNDTSSSIDQTTTYSYHLEDDIIGNYYSVDIGNDNKYGSPIFRLFAGASACPYEPGTQARDAPTMVIDPLEIDNVPATAPASFIAYLHNQSESQETRTYSVSLYPESNPNGAIVKVAGQNITQGTAYFTLGSGATLPVIVTVEKGTFAADYTNLGISFASSCDSFVGITIPITARFQNTCSQVSILQPADGWLVNSSNHDSLLVGLYGYNVNNPSLKEIGLQYRTVGTTGTLSNWTVMNSTILDSANLQGHPIYEYEVFHTPNLNDGNYQIQAYAKCGSGVNTVFTYSAPLNGVIDRSGFSLYGTPQPADGVLDIGGNISLQFNQNIDCNQIYERYQVTLQRADSGTLIPATATCFGNGLVITTNPPSLLDSLDGVVLTATVDKVHDINGNEQGAPISWSFLVNRSKIYWSPANATLTTVQGSPGLVNGTILNVGPADSFTIVKLPTWLTLSQSGPNILPQGTPSSPSQFHLPFISSSSLNQGHYADTVIAEANGKRLNFFVSLDVVTQAPNWSVNAASFSKNMNITANYSITDSSAPLSTDRRDMIAAFVGEQCRGVGYITYSGTALNKYAAYLTVYSNTTQGDTFTFRMWNALSGTEYRAKERLPFLADASIGQIAAPYVLHAGGVYQTIPLSIGWNWFSLNVTNNDMSPATLLKGIRLNDSLIVKSKDNYALYTRASGWTGSLTALNTTNSYMINIDHADTLHMFGQAITGTTVMHIATGWNWIGFPRHKIAVASDFISPINPGNNDLLKSETQFMQYTSAWAGNLTYMYPGQGYRLRSGKDINQLVIQPDRALPGWTVESDLYQQNMTVTTDLQFNGISTTQSHYIVGAFVNGVCVGTAQPQYIAPLNVYRLFMTIHGDTANANQSITYRVYDTDNDVEYVPTYLPQVVAPDEVDGSLAAPYVINVETATGIHALNYLAGYNLQQNVPNPFAANTSITYTIPAAGQVVLTIYDEAGRLISELVNARQEAGTHTVSFAQDNLQSGVYLYQMKSGDFVKTRRMLIF